MKWLSAFVMFVLLAAVGPARAQTQLTFYYPIAVGGPLTKVIDGYAADFEKQNPGVKVKPIYAGNYDDARIKALDEDVKVAEEASERARKAARMAAID